jgi:hypothetical protein
MTEASSSGGKPFSIASWKLRSISFSRFCCLRDSFRKSFIGLSSRITSFVVSMMRDAVLSSLR